MKERKKRERKKGTEREKERKKRERKKERREERERKKGREKQEGRLKKKIDQYSFSFYGLSIELD